jgi:hypothetical protein
MNDADRLTKRLREIAARLRERDLDSEEAEALAREAADLVGQASSEIDRAFRHAMGGEGA